ncbi:MAG: hypothetical protein H8E71_00095 [Candidatus Marinimicrobia bacterium]|nr:hypothetical protein [Candidatus Neomarinimicrobiota bacterium]
MKLFFVILLFVGCEDLSKEDEVVFNFEPRLEQDESGYYHLELDSLSNQTLHRLSGHIYKNGEPLDLVKFYWESSHYWVLGDTLGYIIHRGLTDDLIYVSYDTTYIIGFSDFVVPTINCCSYSNAEGEVNTMFGPIWKMRFDTVTVTVGYFHNNNLVSESIEIVLD